MIIHVMGSCHSASTNYWVDRRDDLKGHEQLGVSDRKHSIIVKASWAQRAGQSRTLVTFFNQLTVLGVAGGDEDSNQRRWRGRRHSRWPPGSRYFFDVCDTARIALRSRQSSI